MKTIKKIKPLKCLKEILAQARLLATKVGIDKSEKIEIYVIDMDDEKISISDDADV